MNSAHYRGPKKNYLYYVGVPNYNYSIVSPKTVFQLLRPPYYRALTVTLIGLCKGTPILIIKAPILLVAVKKDLNRSQAGTGGLTTGRAIYQKYNTTYGMYKPKPLNPKPLNY